MNTSGAGGNCAEPLDDLGTGTQTCNGDGSGTIRTQGVGSTYYESHRGWQHLANAGLIEGNYTGTRLGTTNVSINVVPGQNAPAGRISTTTYTLAHLSEITTSTERFPGPASHTMDIGRARTNDRPADPFLTSEELWNIDTKIDDGKPAYGRIRTFKATSSEAPGCSTLDDPATSQYALSTKGVICVLLSYPSW